MVVLTLSTSHNSLTSHINATCRDIVASLAKNQSID